MAIDFLNWLRPRDIALAEANEATYLQWLAGGTTTRSIALRFLNWAKQRRLAPAWKETAPPVSKKAPRVAREDQKTLTELVTRSTDLGARDRAVGILTLVFAQRIESIALIARSDVKITADTVSILLGGFPVTLPPPLDEPFRELMANPAHQQTAAHPTPKWLFPGQKPGSPIDAGYLSRSMKRLFQARAARLGSLSELSKLGPAPIIAEALGYSVHTIEAHRIDSGDNYARYISARIEASPAE